MRVFFCLPHFKNTTSREILDYPQRILYVN